MIHSRNTSLICLLLCTLCATASAQSASDQFLAAQKILPHLNLTDEQQHSVQDILQPLLKQANEVKQAAQKATPQELQAKMKELETLEKETLDKTVAVLTDDQKAKYFPQMAEILWLKVAKSLVAMKRGVASLDITEDQKKQALTEMKKAGDSIASIQPEAKKISDEDGETVFIAALAQPQLDLYSQLRDELGDEDTGKLIKAGKQPAPKSAPATKP